MQNRLLDEQQVEAVLRRGEYGFLSMVEKLDDGAGGYGISFSYVWDGQQSIYFRCATDGYKLNCLKHNNKVTFVW